MVKCKMSETDGVGPGRKDASKLRGRPGWLIAAGTLRAGGIFGPSLAFVLSFSKSFSADSGTFKNIVLLTSRAVRTHRVIVVYFLVLFTYVFSPRRSHACVRIGQAKTMIFSTYHITLRKITLASNPSLFKKKKKIRLIDNSPDFLRFE